MSACGLPAWECVIEHWAPALGARAGSAGNWNARCLICGNNSLSLTPKDRRIAWKCHTKPPCDPDQIRDALAAKIPCVARRPGRPAKPPAAEDRTVRTAELEPLLGLSHAATKLRLAAIIWNCSPKEAAAKLEMPDRTFYRAISEISKGRKP